MSKIVLLTGFLGSGKTTLLKDLLSHYSLKYKIGIIQNEYSEVSTDAQDLKNTKWKFDLIELNKGSIFCICLYADFRQELERLVKESQPDVIFIEASGLADPISIGSLLDDNKYFYLSKVVAIVDAVTFPTMYKYIRSITNQVRVADIVLVNKFDKITPEQADIIKNAISEINSDVRVFFTCYGRGDFDPEIILQGEQTQSMIQVETNSEPQISEDMKRGISPEGLTPAPLSDISSRVYKSTNKIDRDNLLRFSKRVPSQIIRLKGFINCSDGKGYMIQFVKGDNEAKLTNCENVTRTEVIVIGTDIPELEIFK